MWGRTLPSGLTYVGCRQQRVGQDTDAIVSVEPWHQQHAKGHVYQKGHQDVGFPADRQTEIFPFTHLNMCQPLMRTRGKLWQVSWGVTTLQKWIEGRRSAASPHEGSVSCGWLHWAQRPHVFRSVAPLVTCGQFTGQEVQRIKIEDPEIKWYEEDEGS